MQTLKKGSQGEDVKTLQQRLHLAADGIFGSITEEAVRAFQQSNGLTPDGIVGAKTWGKLLESHPADGSVTPTETTGGITLRKSARAITEIIIHCSATAEGKDFTVQDITNWHRARGFQTIGYHYVIYRDGTLHEGRNIDLIGAHCTGHNARSIGICYIGGCTSDGKTPKDTRTVRQHTALRALLQHLRKLYPQARIYGHRNFANKACPSFNAREEYIDI